MLFSSFAFPYIFSRIFLSSRLCIHFEFDQERACVGHGCCCRRRQTFADDVGAMNCMQNSVPGNSVEKFSSFFPLSSQFYSIISGNNALRSVVIFSSLPRPPSLPHRPRCEAQSREKEERRGEERGIFTSAASTAPYIDSFFIAYLLHNLKLATKDKTNENEMKNCRGNRAGGRSRGTKMMWMKRT